MDEAGEQWQFLGIQEEYPRIGWNPIDQDAEDEVARFLSSSNSQQDITPEDHRIGVGPDYCHADSCYEEQLPAAFESIEQLPAVIESLEHAMTMNAIEEPVFAVEEPVFSVIEDEEEPAGQTTLSQALSNKVVPLKTALKSQNRWRTRS